ncbi:2-oxoglutarate dehydrogenase E1 component [Labilibaculum antarcticum]|uniref:oxoglutarate dehydrogenase (succinyl-transferring) n=1 Tax=Labilibaculum antarcticum TaxID=1717717 RepID=A0A1Y1CKW6_9BACT|nr:2-oxoglutarate dehydrogenase E1 component [Labilibaculum antarcticum]BAX80985.1 2-oxoglutarate dehydrogenase E1 component [Labilibaculum antarcticum]
MDKFSFLGNSEIEYIDKLYQSYKNDPKSVEESWRQFFQGFDFATTKYPGKEQVVTENIPATNSMSKEFNVMNLVQAYRQRGHLFTKTNPVRTRRKYFPTLDIENFDLSESDLETVFHAGTEIGLGASKLKDIVSHLQETYCKSIGAEYVFVRHPQMMRWLQSKMEGTKNTPNFNDEQRKHIYYHLKLAVGFENYIHKKFVGQKRFSLEGTETLIPALDAMIERGAELGVQEFIFGMAHRGRLNVLANILEKPYANIFKEFMGEEFDEDIALGDVKYHLGYGNTVKTDNGSKVKLHLAPNPSHLETVGAVVEGISRSKIDNDYAGDQDKLVPVIIHGDAAIAAQGIVYETVQMSQLTGYKTGGTIHLVINNQIGFTTNYLDARSSTYCTDVAKVTRSPVFHVNGDDVEALIFTIKLAMEYRQEFNSDVFIDILSYRKFGHNEGDEPRFTQPILYKKIAKHKNPRDIYADFLMEKGIYSKEEIKISNDDYNKLLDKDFELSKTFKKVFIQPFLEDYYKDIRHSTKEDFESSPKTGVDKKTLLELAGNITNLPKDLTFFKKIGKLMSDRKKMIENDKLDWAMGELLAYSSLLEEGNSVRVSGQDSERGTFSHRHAALIIENSDEKYFPLKNISDKQAPFHIYNSSLSEYGVLGFEYGYALAHPTGLTIWEAQFGDFHNVAQAVIDQYISAAEDKWGIKNGLVMYLPHGYEGQGAEHSSARMERFLTLCANNNMQIINPTTPANLFHMLRRQVKRDIRVPLICFTPKSLLRHAKCVSKMDELAKGQFQEVIDDNNIIAEEVRRVVFCSGKIYYDLLARKEELFAQDIALVRVEQLYPFPEKQIDQVLNRYPNALLHLWVQEEPENMGAWQFVNYQFKNKDVKLVPVARQSSGSPATGLNKIHLAGQNEIINKVFRKCNCDRKLKYCGLQCVEGSSHADILLQHEYFAEKKSKLIM